jgi:glutamate synthase (NADPH/NADH) small chain
VYERDEAVGGLLRFGIPDFKLDKRVVDRRVALLKREGVEFRCEVDVGRDAHARQLVAEADAVIVATGARAPRELPLAGRQLAGVHPAMDYLYARNRAVASGRGRRATREGMAISAHRRHVIVIGGGDTAMDCVANAHRELAASVTVLDSYAPPTGTRARNRAVAGRAETPTHDLRPRRGRHAPMAAHGRRARWPPRPRQPGRHGPRRARTHYSPVPGTEATLPADLVLIAIGFAGPERAGPVEQLDLRLNASGTIDAPHLRDVLATRVCDRRRSARPIARCHGHRRRPPLRAHRRPRPHPRGRHTRHQGRRRRRPLNVAAVKAGRPRRTTRIRRKGTLRLRPSSAAAEPAPPRACCVSS